MTKAIKYSPLALLMITISNSSLASEDVINHGKELVSSHCVQCHDSEVYTRKNHKMT